MKREIYREKTQESCLNYAGGVVDSLRIKDASKTTVRVYEDGFIGTAGKSGECDIDALTQKAKDSLANKVPYPCFEDKAIVLKKDVRKTIIEKKDLVNECRQLLARIVKENPDFVISGKFSVSDDETCYENSDGVKYDCLTSVFAAYFLAKHKDSSNIMDEVYEVSDNVFEPDKIAQDAKNLFDAFLNKLPQTEENTATIIIEPSVVSYMIQAFVAEIYCNGASLLNGKLGSKVFNEKFSLLCDGNPDTNLGAVFFDGEGVVNDGFKAYLVKKGVMANLLTTKKSAKQFNVNNVGTAAAPFASVPSIGARLTVETTAKDIRDLIGSQKAIFVTMSSGGDMTPSGDISLPVQVSYLYENGKLAGRLPGFAITGSVFDIFGKDFIGVCEKCVKSAGRNKYLVFRANLVNKEN